MSLLRSKFTAIGLVAIIGFAACGDDSSSLTTDAATTPTADGDGGDYDYSPVAETNAADTTVDDSGGGDDVMLADSDLGQILVDGAGTTLYLFATDPPDTATCTGGCAGTWPAMPASDDLHVGDGLDDDLFTTIAGESGPQLSFNGHPLYYYAGDSSPGDTNGQGVGGVWFAIGADGDPVTG